MKMLLGTYTVTDHALEQYDERIKSKKKADVLKCIKHDLRTMNIKNIVRKGNEVHIFTKGYKEFIFHRRNNFFILKTVIKRNFEDTRKTVYKRKNKPCYS
jgi:negative regulator of sigma E activity